MCVFSVLRRLIKLARFVIIILVLTSVAFAENIDPYEDDSQYAYGENVGWLNFEPNIPGPNVGATVSDSNLTGFIWAENVGWLNFDPNVPGDSNDYGVTIDSDGDFDGWAWGENIGWIHFQAAAIVDWDDLANFVAQWLQEGIGLEADLYEDEKVDFLDYSILADYWLDDSPPDWQLGPAGYKVKTSWTAMP